MLPKTKIQVFNRTIWISNAYLTYNKEIAYVGYVKTKKGLLVRTFFFSRSQAVGRVLIGYKSRVESGQEIVTHNEKGYDEQSLNLPIEVQEQMALQSQKPIKVENSDFIFYGTVSDLNDLNCYKQVQKKPLRLAGHFYSNGQAHLKPENLKFDDLSDYPDFLNPLNFWNLKSELYGNLRVFIFLSFNKKYIFQFNVTSNNFNWLANIQLYHQKLSDCGVNLKWVDGGYLSTPFYEYKSQSFGFGSPISNQATYVNMNQKFLRKIPLLFEFKTLLDYKKKPLSRREIPIRPVGSFKYFSRDGQLKVDLSSNQISSEWLPPINYILRRLKKAKGIKSVYVRGSVADGTAMINVSDLDIVYCAEKRMDNFEKKLSLDFKKKFSFVDRVEFLRFSEQDILIHSRSKKSYHIRTLLKTQCVHLYGNDLRKLISIKVRRKDLVCHLPDLMNEYKLMGRRLSYHEIYGDFDAQNRWFSKRIVRSGFELNLKKSNFYTRDLYYCYLEFAKYYPDYRSDMFSVLKNCFVGNRDVRDFVSLINFIDSERKKLWPRVK
ncbi:MAG: hypothetical protein ACK5V3_07990 [Bdellovibrionales bacterium]